MWRQFNLMHHAVALKTCPLYFEDPGYPVPEGCRHPRLLVFGLCFALGPRVLPWPEELNPSED
jgi:hypothetical protein